jgi:hypothetical protein
MKFSIGWHEDCLKNQKASYKANKERIEREFQRLARDEASIIAYEMQIEEAKAMVMDGFDPDRFLKKRSSLSAAPL